MVSCPACRYLVETLAETRIQLCGRLVARIERAPDRAGAPGPPGPRRLRLPRRAPPPAGDARRADRGALGLGGGLRPAQPAPVEAARRRSRRRARRRPARRYPDDAWIDLEAASEGLHRAESAVARGDWKGAWGPGRVAQHVSAARLPTRRGGRLDRRAAAAPATQIHLRSLELVGDACLRIGGGELATAERAARSAIALSPVQRKRSPAADGGARGARESRRGAARLRRSAGTAARRAGDGPERADAGAPPAATRLRSPPAPPGRPPARRPSSSGRCPSRAPSRRSAPRR